MANPIRRITHRFFKDETASLVAEAVIMLPLLVWWYVGGLVFFHGYEARNVNMKAAYTVSDMLSREDAAVGPAYVEGLGNIYAYLIAGSGFDSEVRVTLLRCSDNCNAGATDRELRTDWSYSTGSRPPLTDADLTGYAEVIPVMPLGDRVILLESKANYQAAFNVGLTADNFENVLVTRPRFVPKIPWDPSL